MAQIKTREPLEIVAGDTLDFTRSLSDFPATNGWSLKYELRGGGQAIEFTSTADGAAHHVKVEEDVTALWLPGDYVLTGYAIEAATGDRHTIYLANCAVLVDQAAAPAEQDTSTHAQRMLQLTEARLEEMAQHVLNRSNVQETEFERVNRLELLKLRNHYKAEVANEQDRQRAQSGQKSRNKVTPLFNITPNSPIGVTITGPFRT